MTRLLLRLQPGTGSNAAYVVSIICNDMKTEVIDNITIEKVK